MTLDELLKQSETDSQIDRTNLGHESLRTPELVNKYLKELMREKIALRDLEAEYDTLFLDRMLYYTGKADAAVYKQEPFDLKVLKGDASKYIDADPKIITIKKKLSLREEKVRFLEETIKTMNNRNFAIKNAIDWQKFTNGGY